ncbi:hypothetical protein [Cellulomonas sp. HZM]|uniref:hypothetical protein n=1 Tax=Cellulomonas sp. HZM TaxID=1454010 RepID=UPI000493765E|nr:hypothetical protein [Cellulomonas sp. HZM]
MTTTTIGVIAAVVVIGAIVAGVIVLGVRASRDPAGDVQELARRGFVRIEPVRSAKGRTTDWLITPLCRADATTNDRERIWLDALFHPHRSPVLWSKVSIPFAALGDRGADGVFSDGGSGGDAGGGDACH